MRIVVASSTELALISSSHSLFNAIYDSMDIVIGMLFIQNLGAISVNSARAVKACPKLESLADWLITYTNPVAIY
jgi:hypothetical protein